LLWLWPSWANWAAVLTRGLRVCQWQWKTRPGAPIPVQVSPMTSLPAIPAKHWQHEASRGRKASPSLASITAATCGFRVAHWQASSERAATGRVNLKPEVAGLAPATGSEACRLEPHPRRDSPRLALLRMAVTVLLLLSGMSSGAVACPAGQLSAGLGDACTVWPAYQHEDDITAFTQR
jgi:hypothetical protein